MSSSALRPTPNPLATSDIAWADPDRAAAFASWLNGLASPQQLRTPTLRMASADASFRRYFRIDAEDGRSRIIMDAPPDKENCKPFVQITALLTQAGLLAPHILDWDEPRGFLLLTDLGTHTMMQVLHASDPQANLPLYQKAIDALIAWQLASRPGVLPPYDATLLRRELELFPDWYLARHRGVAVEGKLRTTLDQMFTLIVERNLASPSVYVHRDFMPRNLMVPPTLGAGVSPQPPQGAVSHSDDPAAKPMVPGAAIETRLGVLDFQDAVYGPITYDIASLMRDAFLSWDEDFVIDVTVRYWQAARQAGLPVNEDFGEFFRAVEWMGLQRHLKVAGIFARLTLRDGKPKYLADAPRFIAYIRATCARYAELKPLLRLVDEVEGINEASGYAFGRV
jgi:aminoglycoside/choline kinase family phosphotransferase